MKEPKIDRYSTWSDNLKCRRWRRQKASKTIMLLGKDFLDERIEQKIMVTMPEKYESKISSLEESKDFETWGINVGGFSSKCSILIRKQRQEIQQEEKSWKLQKQGGDISTMFLL